MYSCLARAQEEECNCTEGKFRTVSGICSETSDGNSMSLFRFTLGPKSRDWEQGCRSSESSCLPPMWPGFDSGPLSYVGRGCCLFSICSEGFLRVFVFFPP